MCNCEFCIKCECTHQADEHLAGDGPCFLCNCQGFKDAIINPRVAEYMERHPLTSEDIPE